METYIDLFIHCLKFVGAFMVAKKMALGHNINSCGGFLMYEMALQVAPSVMAS